jgi:hypothetical protein
VVGAAAVQALAAEGGAALRTPIDFWNISPEELRTDEGMFVHPEDREDVENLFDYHKDFLNTYPAPYWGPLRTAKLVLAYAGPGNTIGQGENGDVGQAQSVDWLARRHNSLSGDAPLDDKLHHGVLQSWFRTRLRSVLKDRDANLDQFSNAIAFINLTAYRGTETKWEEVAFLPSTQVMRNWARSDLFPDAEAGRRVVIIMRAHKWWGIRKAPWSKGSLFAPPVNRAGVLLSEQDVGKAAQAAARKILGLPPMN